MCALTGVILIGCATKFRMSDLKDKQVLLTLAGGAAGALVTFNTGGAIVGAFVADIVNLTAIKYEDKQLEDREEAARRLKDRYKAEKKEEDKKAEELKEENKKAEKKKEEDKKAEGMKGEDKKAEKLKEENKKAEKVKGEDRRVQLFIENSSVISHNVKIGSIAEANVQYTLLAPLDMRQIKITETRILHTAARRMELDKREIIRTQGTYVSTIKFTVPEDIPRGYCILFTTISDGTHAKTTKSVMNII
jgi:uncharacterized membrane protein YgaE (UPF0421/DUF939 family)